ncbi:MAG: hypothetical protein H6Q86_3859 [candidate division NC10 bacterium]|nr:hypothetical protein [candidate division NC10 bacterium]
MNTFIDRHADTIRGVLSCFDRVVRTGTLPDLFHAEAMARFLGARQIRLFDYPRWAEPFRDTIRTHAEQLAREQGLTIEFIRRLEAFRKEDRIKALLAQRGDHPGLVHIFSAMEACPSFKPWHDKRSGKTVLRGTEAKCLHYCFYFIDKDLGLCYLRVPTWAPFRLQFYCNGHQVLARQLQRTGIAYTLLDKPLPRSPTGRGPRRSPMRGMSPGSTGTSTAWPRPTARCSPSSPPASTGAACRWSTPPMWSSTAKPSSSPCTTP